MVDSGHFAWYRTEHEQTAGGTYRLVTGLGHYIMLDQPERFRTELNAFLTR